MSRSRDYIGDLPSEFVERLKRKGKLVTTLEDLTKEFVEFKNEKKTRNIYGLHTTTIDRQIHIAAKLES